MPRIIIRRRAALIFGLLLGLSFAPAPADAACTGDNCRTSAQAKPLNLMRFMDQGTPATGARKTPPARRRAASHTRRAQRHIDAAARPSKAAKASAAIAQPQTESQAQASDGSDTINRAVTAAADQNASTVQMVDAAEFNEIDRKADGAEADGTSSSAAAKPTALSNDGQTDDPQADNSLAENAQINHDEIGNAEADASQAVSPRAESSWTRWAWSVLEATVTAFATAIHALIG